METGQQIGIMPCCETDWISASTFVLWCQNQSTLMVPLLHYSTFWNQHFLHNDKIKNLTLASLIYKQDAQKGTVFKSAHWKELLVMHTPCMKGATEKCLTSSCLLVSLKDFSNVSIRCILALSVSSWPCSSLTCSSLSGSVFWGSPSNEATCLWVSSTFSLSIRMFWLYLQTQIS